MKRHFPSVITVTSGKGGVGKTSLSVCLAAELAAAGKNVVLLDADLGLANVDVVLGITPEKTLFSLFEEGVSIRDVLCPTPYGFSVLPATSGILGMASLSTGQKLELLNAVDGMADDIDYLIADSGAGVSGNVLYFSIAAQERLVVVTPEPTSVTDAYALIKILTIEHGIENFRIAVNRAADRRQAMDIFRRVYEACDHFLSGVRLSFAGFIPQDPAVRRALMARQPFSIFTPDSPAAAALREMAAGIAGWQTPMAGDGNIKFFWKTLLCSRTASDTAGER